MQTSHAAPVQSSGFASPCLVLRVHALSWGFVCHRSPLPASGGPPLWGAARRPPCKATSPVLIPAAWAQGWGLPLGAGAASGQPGLSDPHVEGGTAQNKMEKLKKKKKEEEKNICGVGDLRNIKGNRLNKGPSLCRRQAHSE